MKKLKPYIYTILISLAIFMIVFITKGIYPFGKNSLIYGDMHGQITAFYYHFYDSIHSSKSLLVDFTTGGGINFIGIIAYYILSPFNLLLLLIPRENIYLMVSVVISLKLIICSLTCLYFLRTYFKNIPSLIHILLALIYGFSSYGLILYQITPWIDAMYMFPILMIGLKKLLDLEKPTLYIIALSLSLIFCFYVTSLSLIFIFIVSIIYLYVYKDKDTRKKAITSLGLATILSLGISCIVLIPACLEIGESSRVRFNLEYILNSKTGPIRDKVNMLAFGSLVYASIILLLMNFKKHKKFLRLFIPTIVLLLIPVIIEPIHKVWHLGSYASFPYRFGYITNFILIIASGYFFNNYKEFKTNELKNSKIISILLTSISVITTAFLTYKYYYKFQTSSFHLSISYTSILIFISIIILIVSTVSIFFILKYNKKNTFQLILIYIISIVYIISSSFINLGLDKYQNLLTSEYVTYNEINKDIEKDNYYIKNEIEDIILNSGMIINHNSWDHFTSLTNKNDMEAIKKLGYSSMWVKIYSKGSNIFTDSILANKYLITDTTKDEEFYRLIKKYDTVNFYELKGKIPFGVLISKNDTIFDKNNSFEIANSLYKNILNTSDKLFTYDENFELKNIKITGTDDDLNRYEKIDKDYNSYFEKEIEVKGKKRLYLELNRLIDNSKERELDESFNLYINGKLFKKDAYSEQSNGVVDLGTYKDEKVDIKIELMNTLECKNFVLGIMDIEKYNDFINNYYINTDVKYNKNKINIKVSNTEDNKILLLPLAYSDNYKASNNNKKIDIFKVYDNFVGIKLENGVNNITLTYIPNGLTSALIISLSFIIITVLLIKLNIYNKIIENGIINSTIYYLYLFAYIAFIFLVYILLTICFFISFIKYISI